ncbi:MAG TPA: hypothetical protein VNO79_01310 [Actinomycetota bacterium]|nr:hypothetical protein [Actinomycetota bacterium]
MDVAGIAWVLPLAAPHAADAPPGGVDLVLAFLAGLTVLPLAYWVWRSRTHRRWYRCQVASVQEDAERALRDPVLIHQARRQLRRRS